jgi:phage gp36-like protein
MTDDAKKQAESYLKDSLRSQRELGYSGRVDKSVFESAVKDAARAVDRLLKAQRPPKAA